MNSGGIDHFYSRTSDIGRLFFLGNSIVALGC